MYSGAYPSDGHCEERVEKERGVYEQEFSRGEAGCWLWCGVLTLPASLTLDASAIAPIEGTNTLMLFSVSNGITGSVAGWTVVPKRFTVKMKDGNQVLLAPSQGSMILVW